MNLAQQFEKFRPYEKEFENYVADTLPKWARGQGAPGGRNIGNFIDTGKHYALRASGPSETPRLFGNHTWKASKNDVHKVTGTSTPSGQDLYDFFKKMYPNFLEEGGGLGIKPRDDFQGFFNLEPLKHPIKYLQSPL